MTTVAGNARAYVAPPSYTPSGFGLLSVVQPRWDEPDSHWRAGVTWQPLCGIADSTYDPCVAVTGVGSPPAPPAKQPTATNTPRGATPFTVVAEFDCSPAVFAAESNRLAVESLSRTESWQVERAFWTGVAGGQPVVFPHLAADGPVSDSEGVLLQTAATPVTGAVVEIAEGLGLLEAGLADCYNGIGVIHVPQQLIAVMSGIGLLVKDGPRLRTLAGNLVAAGSGYPGTGPDGSPPQPGSAWMYATGAVFAYRSGIEVTPVASTVNRSNNNVHAIAERTYVLGWDCCHLAVQVSGSPFLGGDSDLLSSTDFKAAAPLVWDAGAETVSLQPGVDGQYLGSDGGTAQWLTPGQPGNLPGPLDGTGKIPASQLPPAELHATFDAASEAEMLAEPVTAPAICVRTDFDPPHLFYLVADPASDISNWHDLGAAVTASADPTAKVGTAPVNGAAGTYMRSDAAPAIDEAMSPMWSGHHTFAGQVTIPTGAGAGRVATSDGSGNLSWAALTKASVGLGNVDNTSDVSKPISTATKAYVDAAVAEAGGGLQAPVTHSGSTDITLAVSDPPVHLVDASAGDVVVNLPDAGDGAPAGKTFTVKKTDASANGITIDAGEASIDDQASVGVASQYSYRTMIFDGTNWHIIGQSGS